MATAPDRATSPLRLLDDDEARQFFDDQARRLLNMSGAEFIQKYDAGELDAELGGPQHRALAQLVMLLPFGR